MAVAPWRVLECVWKAPVVVWLYHPDFPKDQARNRFEPALRSSTRSAILREL